MSVGMLLFIKRKDRVDGVYHLRIMKGSVIVYIYKKRAKNAFFKEKEQ